MRGQVSQPYKGDRVSQYLELKFCLLIIFFRELQFAIPIKIPQIRTKVGFESARSPWTLLQVWEQLFVAILNAI